MTVPGFCLQMGRHGRRSADAMVAHLLLVVEGTPGACRELVAMHLGHWMQPSPQADHLPDGETAAGLAADGLAASEMCRHDAHMEIRDAVTDDAAAACQVLRRSISELCDADHGNDPAVLERWLCNKTPEIVATWITDPNASVLVAIERGMIVAVGAVTDRGEITLNYVSPDVRFQGVSRVLLGALETRAAERGNRRCTLTSTQTARRFYRANGYAEDGVVVGKFGSDASYPMSKPLIPLKTS